MKILITALFAAGTLAAQTIVIQNGTVMPITKPAFKGSVVVKDGKIVEVGEKVIIPQGATVIDAAGQYVMPGIIDAHSHIAIEGGVNEMSLSDTAMSDIVDVINPEDIAIYRALAGGVTTAHLLHGSANSVGGQTITAKMRWGKDAKGLIFEGAPPGLKFAMGENPKRSGNPAGRGGATAAARYPATRMGVEDVIRQGFNDARIYQAEWADYRAKLAKGESPLPPRKDLRLEPLVEVLEGKRFVHAHCYRADEILMMLHIADDYGFKVHELIHALEAYKVADEIARHGAGVTTFSDWWAFKVEAFDAIPYNAAILQKKGVLTSINSDDAELMRHLNLEAAKTMKYGGLTETEALSMITINPAKQLGIEKRVGSLEAGKDADIVIFDKHPLSDYAKVQKVLIDGAVYFDRDKDVSGRSGKAADKQKLIDKEKQSQPRGQQPTRRTGA
jgi:imidazolonepropionase-like amidohydrolase